MLVIDNNETQALQLSNISNDPLQPSTKQPSLMFNEQSADSPGVSNLNDLKDTQPSKDFPADFTKDEEDTQNAEILSGEASVPVNNGPDSEQSFTNIQSTANQVDQQPKLVSQKTTNLAKETSALEVSSDYVPTGSVIRSQKGGKIDTITEFES